MSTDTRSPGRHPALRHRRGRNGERDALVRGQVAGHAHHAERIGAVGQRVDLDHRVGVQAERLGDTDPRLERRGQDEDARVVVAELQLAGRAQHAVALLTAHPARRDRHAVGHDRPDGGQRNQVAGRHVGGAAADLQSLAVTPVDVHESDPIGVGMLTHVEHPSHHDAVRARCRPRRGPRPRARFPRAGPRSCRHRPRSGRTRGAMTGEPSTCCPFSRSHRVSVWSVPR